MESQEYLNLNQMCPFAYQITCKCLYAQAKKQTEIRCVGF